MGHYGLGGYDAKSQSFKGQAWPKVGMSMHLLASLQDPEPICLYSACKQSAGAGVDACHCTDAGA